MSTFNYAALSAQDFEEVTRDLLQAEWAMPIESFKAGRDSGIDLRYATCDGSATIIQCKHYLKSGFDKLLAHLIKIELPKVQKLAPTRYLVATTVELTPANKDRIIEAFSPYILRPGDVLGAGDIDGLLRRHPQVERANFKLWLTSTSVLERILHNAEISRTDFEVERVRKKLPLFVQNSAFPRAKEMLASTKVLVISGIPGIGKTTLAEMLLYSYLEEGYKPVVIQGEIAEGRKLFHATERQIFYYDDFLGQTFFGDRKEYLGRNEDKAIVDFMEMVRTAKDSKFVLTTREHILSEAVRLSASLDDNPVLRDRIVLELDNYTFGERARMLYNHLYFSDLPQEHKDALLINNFFLQVIRHPHFNPRLVEWLSTYRRLGAVAAPDFAEYVAELLNNPAKLWEHAFHEQISEPARNVLLVMASVGSMEAVEQIEPLFDVLHSQKARKYNFRVSALDFKNALRELDTSFLRYSGGWISFLNPSIKEYLGSALANDIHTCRDIWAAVLRFKQLMAIWRLAETRPGSALSNFLRDADCNFIGRIFDLAHAPYFVVRKSAIGSQVKLIDCHMDDRVGFISEYCEARQLKSEMGPLLDFMKKMLADRGGSGVWWSLPSLLEDIDGREWFVENGGSEICLLLLDMLLSSLSSASADDWSVMLDIEANSRHWTPVYSSQLATAFEEYQDQGLAEELDSKSSLSEKRSTFESLEKLSSKTQVSFRSAMDRLEEEINVLEAEEEEPKIGTGAPTTASEDLRARTMSDADVCDMFQTLAAG